MTLPSETRDRLLKAAGDQFYEQGVNGTSMQDVIDAAGLTRPTLYAHFRSKEVLLAAVLIERHQQRMAELDRFDSAAGSDPRACLLATFDWLDEHYREQASKGCGFLNVAAEQLDSPIAVRAIAEHKQWMFERLSRHARDVGLQEPEQIGRQLLLLVDGVSGYVVANVNVSADEVAAVIESARRAAEILVHAAGVEE